MWIPQLGSLQICFLGCGDGEMREKCVFSAEIGLKSLQNHRFLLKLLTSDYRMSENLSFYVEMTLFMVWFC